MIMSESLLVLILGIVCDQNVSVFRVFRTQLPTGWQFTAGVGMSRFVDQDEC